ncbi:porin family protein [Lutibacter sp.]
MKKYGFVVCLCFALLQGRAQESSNTVIDENYLEDQLYLSFTYNMLTNKPATIATHGFSGSYSIGFIKDIPLNKRRNIGFGVGIGYTYNAYIQNLKITENSGGTLFEVAQDYTTNKFITRALEMPIELRWRTSTPSKYKFWRVYSGIKFSYLLLSKATYSDVNTKITAKNIPEVNKLQYGLTMAAGYGTWNLYVYYGLSSFFDNAFLDSERIDISDFTVGLKFYIM